MPPRRTTGAVGVPRKPAPTPRTEKRRPAKPAEVDVIADAAPCTCTHPRARHWHGGGGYPPVCLHGSINPTDPCPCTTYTKETTAA